MTIPNFIKKGIKNMDALSYSEVWSILSQIDVKTAIPEHVLEFIEENRIKEYDANIDLNIPLEHQNISTKAINLLCYLNMEYLSNAEEKESLIRIYKNNEKNLLKKSYTEDKKKNLDPNLLPTLIKAPKWYEKLWKNIKSLFNLKLKTNERIS